MEWRKYPSAKRICKREDGFKMAEAMATNERNESVVQKGKRRPGPAAALLVALVLFLVGTFSSVLVQSNFRVYFLHRPLWYPALPCSVRTYQLLYHKQDQQRLRRCDCRRTVVGLGASKRISYGVDQDVIILRSSSDYNILVLTSLLLIAESPVPARDRAFGCFFEGTAIVWLIPDGDLPLPGEPP